MLTDEQIRHLAHEQYGLEVSEAQLRWRELKRAEIGDDLFRQEFPSTAEEAVQAAEGLILPNPETCLIDSLPFDYKLIQKELKVGGIDFGCSDTDATVIWSGVYWRDVLYLTHYWRGLRSLSEERVAGLVAHHKYYCDPSGLEARRELAKQAMLHNVPVTLAIPCRARGTVVSAGTEEIHLLASWMQRGRIKVLASISEQLVIEADSFCWNAKTGKIDDTRDARWGHFDTIFALKYCVMGVFGDKFTVEAVRPTQAIGVRQQMRYV
jgi:hypothetical protein